VNTVSFIALQNRGDFVSLVRNLLGPIYGDGVMNLLIRQARDILVCAYHGNLDNFVRTYLSPAAVLLTEVKNVASETVSYFTMYNCAISV
jgi:transcription antitermination factor NusA-like protein